MPKLILKKLSLLNQASIHSATTGDKHEILKNFMKTGKQILEADFCFVWYKPRGFDKYQLFYTSPNLHYIPSYPRKKGGANQLAQHRKLPLLIKDVSTSTFLSADTKAHGKSVIVIPIFFQNKMYGNAIFGYKKTRTFTQEEYDLSASFGNALAQALTISRLNHRLQDIKHTLDYTPEPMLIFDPTTQNISYFNNSLLSRTSLNKALLSRANIKNIIHPSFQKIFQRRMKHILSKKIPSSIFDVVLTSDKNRKIPAEMSLQYISLPKQPPHFMAIFRDLRERKKSEKQIRHAAFHDTLTGLPNRFLFTKRLGALIKKNTEEQSRFAVIFLDLDRFKLINDTLGHLKGDVLLQQTAQRFRRNVKRTDTVSRIAGDEFVILLSKIHSFKQLDEIAKRIRKTFQDPFTISLEQEIYVTCSMGISIFPEDGTTAEMLLKNADYALYHAKQDGGNKFRYYDKNMSPLKAGQLEIEKELRQAITKKELFLEYQPIVDINTNRITGAEALIRWKHKTLGSISPSVFIPYSEESGQIIQLGEWVFTESCSQLAEWRKAKLNVTLNINISARELLEENVIRKMQQLVKLANLPPKDIILEMTETFLIKDMKSFAKIVEQIKKLGFKTALDDFGTGYASLLYLKSLPVDYIKIDKSFIRGSITNEQDAAIIKAIISIAHNLGIKVIAEGVEKETENLFLKTYGCDMVQGNYYSRPISGEQFKLLTQKVPLTHART